MTINVQLGVFNAQSVKNKAVSISEEIKNNEVSLLVLSETWLNQTSNGTVLHDLLPDRYSIVHEPCVAKQVGGVAVVHRNTITVRKQLYKNTATTAFEVLERSIVIGEHSTQSLCVYRPPSSLVTAFLDEFEDLLYSHCFHSTN